MEKLGFSKERATTDPEGIEVVVYELARETWERRQTAAG
jgi:hypothetical protein